MTEKKCEKCALFRSINVKNKESTSEPWGEERNDGKSLPVYLQDTKIPLVGQAETIFPIHIVGMSSL
jgi:hypothetical protein